MKLLSAPRQPFVGLATVAAIGIMLADFFPLPSSALFGTVEVIAPPRNPGEFDMRSYLARRDVHRLLFVRYPEDGTLIRHRGGNPILHAAQKSRAWMQNALCRGLETAPEVQNFLSGI